MAAARLLFLLLAVLLLLGDVIAARTGQSFPHPTAAIMLGLVLGELALVATWAACSRGSWVARVAICWSAAALAAWPLALFSGPTWHAWAGLLLIYSATIATGWRLLLASGYQWQWPFGGEELHRTALLPHQFSLKWMLKTITACSLALGLGSWFALPAHDPWLAVATIVTLGFCVPVTISTLLLETRRWWVRAAVPLLLPLAGGILVALHGGAAAKFLVVLCGVQTVVLLLAATVMSAAGGEIRARESAV
jgi:hypothetical protein